MKNLSWQLISSMLVVLCTTVIVSCGPPPGGPPPMMTGTPKVATILLETAPLTLTSELPGRITPVISAEVRPQITGIIQKRLFTEGATVKAGQLLYQIDPASYRAAVNSAKAELEKAKASLELAKLKTKRNRELVGTKAISRQALDESEATQKEAEADVTAAQAALDAQQINLEYTQIRSPVSGRISRSSYTVGALVTANQAEALATVQQLDPIYVDVTQTSLALLELKRSLASGSMKQGSANVDIVLQNDLRYDHTGTLQFSEAMVDQSTDSVTLRVEVANPDGNLLPGMYAKAVIELGVIEDALLVPQRSVRRDAQGKPLVSIVDNNNIIQDRAVHISRAIDNQWLIDDGLKAGENLVLEGSQKVRAGSKVEIVSSDKAVDTTQIRSR